MTSQNVIAKLFRLALAPTSDMDDNELFSVTMSVGEWEEIRRLLRSKRDIIRIEPRS